MASQKRLSESYWALSIYTSKGRTSKWTHHKYTDSSLEGRPSSSICTISCMLLNSRPHSLCSHHHTRNLYAFRHHRFIRISKILVRSIYRIRTFRFSGRICSSYHTPRKIDFRLRSQQLYSL
jgi:hypothetical protein